MQLRATRLTAIASAVKRAIKAFSPAQLFGTGAPGVWYDPSDMSTLFQDSAGTTPVTAVEQPVGLMLDKSQGLVLGPELVVNGTFDTDTSWGKSAWWTISGGSASMPSTSAYYPLAQNIGVSTGKFYQVTFSVLAITGTMKVAFDDATLASNTVVGEFSTTGTKSFIFSPPPGETYIVFSRLSPITASGTIDNISVRELPGNHAYQTTSTSRPVLSARYNLLTKTEQFDDAVWTKSAATITANTTATTDPLGGNTADKLQETTASAFHYAEVAPGVTVGASYTVSFYAKAAERTWCSVFGAGKAPSYFDLSNGVTGTAAANTTISMQNVGNGWYRCFYTATAAISSNTFGITSATGNNQGTYIGTTGSGIYIWGASLVPANQSSLPYQRVNTATDYNTTGFLPYLKFDGVDDSLSTNSISFTSTDKMSVFAGVRRLVDAAAAQAIAELSSAVDTNAGTFLSYTQTSSRLGFASRGSASAVYAEATQTAAPFSLVYTGLGDISGDRATLRVNGTQVAQSTTDQGTGNYGNYPIFIGRRGGTSLPFNGQLYSMIIVGKAVTAGELSSTEKFVASKTGVTL